MQNIIFQNWLHSPYVADTLNIKINFKIVFSLWFFFHTAINWYCSTASQNYIYCRPLSCPTFGDSCNVKGPYSFITCACISYRNMRRMYFMDNYGQYGPTQRHTPAYTIEKSSYIAFIVFFMARKWLKPSSRFSVWHQCDTYYKLSWYLRIFCDEFDDFFFIHISLSYFIKPFFHFLIHPNVWILFIIDVFIPLLYAKKLEKNILEFPIWSQRFT